MKKSKTAMALVLAMLVTLGLLALPRDRTKSEAISYAELMKKARNGKITRVYLGQGEELTAEDEDGKRYAFANPRLDEFKHTLLMLGVEVKETPENSAPYLMLLLLAGGTGLLLYRKRQKSEGFVRSGVAQAVAETPSCRFEDVAANDEALDSLRDLVSFIQQPEHYHAYGARIPRGVLLYGPPGTGKTLMARALAGEAGVPFYAVNGADFVEMYVGVGASRIRALFERARKGGKGVIFFDEIDAIGKKRDNTSDEREQTLNALLSEMSGFRADEGIIVLAATNRIDTLDEALLRAGRFDRQIEVPLPGYEERVRILRVHARKKPMDQSVSMEDLAAQTALFSGARLESMLNEAAILAAKRSAERISREDVERAYETQLCGAERKGMLYAEREREITAAHEAGHALASLMLLPGCRVRKVSIIPSSRGAAGYSLSVQPEKMFHHRTELLRHIAVALAGRAAEELAFGTDMTTTGAANDIEKAAVIARRMVCEWGMLPEGGALYLFDQPSRDRAAGLWLEKGYELAKTVIRQHGGGWKRLTALLLEKEAVDEEEVRRCFLPDMEEMGTIQIAADGI